MLQQIVQAMETRTREIREIRKEKIARTLIDTHILIMHNNPSQDTIRCCFNACRMSEALRAIYLSRRTDLRSMLAENDTR